MATYLPQNQFVPNSTAIQPPAVVSDGVGAKPILAPSEAATVSGRAPVAATLTHNKITQAVEIHSSCGGLEGQASEETVSVAVRGLRQRRPRDMEAAGSQREAETGRSPEMARVREQASNCTSQDSDRIAGPAAARDRAGVEPGPQDHIELEQLIGVAGRRRRKPLALPRFAPDFPEIWKAMHDKTAPRTVLDPLWADASPLFLRDAT